MQGSDKSDEKENEKKKRQEENEKNKAKDRAARERKQAERDGYTTISEQNPESSATENSATDFDGTKYRTPEEITAILEEQSKAKRYAKKEIPQTIKTSAPTLNRGDRLKDVSVDGVSVISSLDCIKPYNSQNDKNGHNFGLVNQPVVLAPLLMLCFANQNYAADLSYDRKSKQILALRVGTTADAVRLTSKTCPKDCGLSLDDLELVNVFRDRISSAFSMSLKKDEAKDTPAQIIMDDDGNEIVQPAKKFEPIKLGDNLNCRKQLNKILKLFKKKASMREDQLKSTRVRKPVVRSCGLNPPNVDQKLPVSRWIKDGQLMLGSYEQKEGIPKFEDKDSESGSLMIKDKEDENEEDSDNDDEEDAEDTESINRTESKASTTNTKNFAFLPPLQAPVLNSESDFNDDTESESEESEAESLRGNNTAKAKALAKKARNPYENNPAINNNISSRHEMDQKRREAALQREQDAARLQEEHRIGHKNVLEDPAIENIKFEGKKISDFSANLSGSNGNMGFYNTSYTNNSSRNDNNKSSRNDNMGNGSNASIGFYNTNNSNGSNSAPRNGFYAAPQLQNSAGQRATIGRDNRVLMGSKAPSAVGGNNVVVDGGNDFDNTNRSNSRSNEIPRNNNTGSKPLGGTMSFGGGRKLGGMSFGGAKKNNSENTMNSMNSNSMNSHSMNNMSFGGKKTMNSMNNSTNMNSMHNSAKSMNSMNSASSSINKNSSMPMNNMNSSTSNSIPNTSIEQRNQINTRMGANSMNSMNRLKAAPEITDYTKPRPQPSFISDPRGLDIVSGVHIENDSGRVMPNQGDRISEMAENTGTAPQVQQRIVPAVNSGPMVIKRKGGGPDILLNDDPKFAGFGYKRGTAKASSNGRKYTKGDIIRMRIEACRLGRNGPLTHEEYDVLLKEEKRLGGKDKITQEVLERLFGKHEREVRLTTTEKMGGIIVSKPESDRNKMLCKSGPD